MAAVAESGTNIHLFLKIVLFLLKWIINLSAIWKHKDI